MNRRSLAAVILLVVTALFPVAAQIAEGDAAVAKFDLDGAIRAYRTALSQQPYDYEASWKLARALLDKATLTKDPAAQKTLIQRGEVQARGALQAKPDDSKGHLYVAIAVGKLALFEGGKRQVELSKEVKAEADKAIALNLKEDAAYHVVGAWQYEMVELNFILKKFAEMLFGKFPPASLEDAEKNLRHAAELAPHAVAHQVELGIILRAAGKRDEAKTVLTAALQMPQTWATDDYYKALATDNLARLK